MNLCAINGVMCTSTQFLMALRNPDICLNSLKGIIADLESFNCTKHFAECRATLNAAPILLHAPITPKAIGYATRAIEILRDLDCDIVLPRIIDNELTAFGLNAGYCSLLVEPLTEGMPLGAALHLMTQSHLSYGLSELKQRLRHYDISHNNLHVNNIIVDNEYRWHPMRCYYTTRGYGGDRDGFARIAKLIARYGLTEKVATVEEELSNYTTQNSDKTLYALVEQRRRFATTRGTGFMDAEGNIVIKDIYREATDFEEGRATVTTHEGMMGLINRRGDMVIPAEYDRVIFSIDDGTSWVAKGNLWARFDYNGKQLDEWHNRHTEPTYYQK